MSEQDGFSQADSSLHDLPHSERKRAEIQSQVDFEIDFYRGILEQNPNYLEVLKVLGNNLAAKGLHAESLDIDKQIVALRPKDQVALYNLACSCSMVGMVDDSLEWLKQAIESGYDQFDYMRHDSDLEAARRDPRFRDLLESFGVR